MNIYIDEAGAFVIPRNKPNLVSCVGALIIPESFEKDIFNSFQKIKAEMGFRNSEIKGNRLNESQIAEIVGFLRGYDIIFEVTVIDMALHTDEITSAHKVRQIELLSEDNPIETLSEFVAARIRRMQGQLSNLSNQLYVQYVCMLQLLSNVFDKSTLYYVQRLPSELAKFKWYVDAKNTKMTSYEELLMDSIGPALQSISIEIKFTQLKNADYSYFEKYLKTSPSPPKHLRKAFGDVSPFEYVDITDIFRKNLSYVQSDKNVGIQLVDILTTSIRRAMNNTLRIEGWGNIGALMVQSAKPRKSIQLVHLSKGGTTRVPYFHVVEITNRMSKRMIIKGN